MQASAHGVIIAQQYSRNPKNLHARRLTNAIETRKGPTFARFSAVC
jgi:hypothetical protein